MQLAEGVSRVPALTDFTCEPTYRTILDAQLRPKRGDTRGERRMEERSYKISTRLDIMGHRVRLWWAMDLALKLRAKTAINH